MIYLFDVDGTLTPSRGTMDAEFKQSFFNFIKNHTVWLVTGSDKNKTVEQIGSDLYNSIEYSFNCSGNIAYSYGEEIHRNDWTASDEIMTFLNAYISKSKFSPITSTKHFDIRPGLLNFSVVGCDTVGEQRKRYYTWDQTSNERQNIADAVNLKFEGVEAVVGGEISIDVYKSGCDKSQVLPWCKGERVTFFGNSIRPGGNDYSVAMKSDHYVVVDTWEDTRDWLKENKLI